jgi:hypothetical protein
VYLSKASAHPFWYGLKKFKMMIEEKYPAKQIRYVWNNIVKIGREDGKGLPSDYIYKIEKEYFSVIAEEVRIIKPSIILFLTGPNYDNKIVDNFGNSSFSALAPFNNRALAKISIPDVDFAFRTYHPGYLARSGKNITSFYNPIINEIKY